ncbi:hypothetical protein SAMN05444266_11441 [Chitinophaga jiangningensis]|uniref:Uncharacterized protein n=1 Tax=Chitinophaga jiangningensis TaxID=1419482 RepID=A0A1M7MS29_9BACT|nr:hypothetical protein SAMN05444266_11441 [Chitinophaga jiangningensis]
MGGAYYVDIYGKSPWGLNIHIVGPSLELIDLVNGLHEAPFPLYKILYPSLSGSYIQQIFNLNELLCRKV